MWWLWVYLCYLIWWRRYRSWHMTYDRCNLLQSSRLCPFWARPVFCVSGHSQLWQWGFVIQSDMLSVYHSPAQLFCSFQFWYSALCQLQRLSVVAVSSSLAVSSSWCGYCYGCYTHSLGLLFSGFLITFCPLVAHGQALCASFILFTRHFKWLQ